MALTILDARVSSTQARKMLSLYDWSDEEKAAREKALCRDMDQDLFFPSRGETTNGAKLICRKCPIRVDCLTWGIERNETHGVWGGFNLQERRRVKKMIRQGKSIERAIQKVDEDINRANPLSPTATVRWIS